MKKIALGLLVCLLLLSGMAAHADVMLEHGDEFFASDMVAAGDTLYMLAEQEEGVVTIASWHPGQEKAVAAQTPINYAMYTDRSAVTDGESRIVTKLFTDGQRLMSYDPVQGVVFEMQIRDGAIAYSDVVRVRDAAALYEEGVSSPIHAAADENTLYWLAARWNDDGAMENIFHAVDLHSGSVYQLPVWGILDFEILPDGNLMLLQESSGLVLMDPVTGVVRPHDAQLVWEIYDILYSKEENALLYLENQRVMGFANLTDLTQYAYIPTEPIDAVVMGDTIAVTDGAVTVIRQLQAGYVSAHELTVMSSSYQDQETVLRFHMDNPDTAVYWYQDFSGYLFDQSFESLANLMREQQLDIAVVSLNASGFRQLMLSGMCADLTGYEVLSEKLQDMYPAYVEPLKSDGRVFAVPLSASSWSWFYNPYALEQTGLTREELPTNLIDLCAFVTRWNNELIDEYPGVSLFSYVEDTRSFVLGAMLELYGTWSENQYGILDFNTPVFRQLLAAAEAMECDRIDSAAAESYVWTDGLLGNDLASIGWMQWERDSQDGYAEWLPMALTADVERIEPVMLEVAFVNDNCTGKEKAAELLTALLNGLSDETACTLFSSKTDAVPEPDFVLWKQQAEEYMQWLQQESEHAGDGAWEYEEMIAIQQRYIEEDLPRLEWRVSPQDIAFYSKEMAPYAIAVRANFISNWTSPTNAACFELIDKYCRREVDAEQLIWELSVLY